MHFGGEATVRRFSEPLAQSYEEADDGGAQARQLHNLVVAGGPGTGKTHFARIVARMFRAYGALESDVVVETTGAKLKGEAAGETAAECIALFEAALAPADWVETRAKVAPAAAHQDAGAGEGASDEIE